MYVPLCDGRFRIRACYVPINEAGDTRHHGWHVETPDGRSFWRYLWDDAVALLATLERPHIKLRLRIADEMSRAIEEMLSSSIMREISRVPVARSPFFRVPTS
jgi:hypothetical protein